MEPERCLLCGEVIPEGQQICNNCMAAYSPETEAAAEMAEEIRDIANVLKITANTDANIKQSMESLFNIAGRLERRKNGGRNEVQTKSGALQTTYSRKDSGAATGRVKGAGVHIQELSKHGKSK